MSANYGIVFTQMTSAAQWNSRIGHSSFVYGNGIFVMGGISNDANCKKVIMSFLLLLIILLYAI